MTRTTSLPWKAVRTARAASGGPLGSAEQAQRVLILRRQYPRWGKDKLVRVLEKQGLPLFTSMIGRILADLKRRGVLREPPPVGGADPAAS